MRKLIKLDNIYDIKFASKIYSFFSPEHIYIPIEKEYELLKKQNDKVLKGDPVLENKLKKIRSSISGTVVGTSKLICDGVEKECIVIENNYEENVKETKNKIKNITTDDIINRPRPGSRRLEMLMRSDRERQILPELRHKEAGARSGGRMEMQMRRNCHGQILPRVRLAEACRHRRLAVLLRHGQQGQILL